VRFDPKLVVKINSNHSLSYRRDNLANHGVVRMICNHFTYRRSAGLILFHALLNAPAAEIGRFVIFDDIRAATLAKSAYGFSIPNRLRIQPFCKGKEERCCERRIYKRGSRATFVSYR